MMVNEWVQKIWYCLRS